MSEFAALRPALVSLAQTLTGLSFVDWENQKRDFVPPGTRALVLLSFGTSIGLGRDEIRTTFDEDAEGEEFTDTAVGVRRLPLRMRVDAYEQQDDETAWTYLERARLRLRWTSVVDTLWAMNAAVVEVREVQDLQVPEDEHIVSRASLDIILGWMVEEVDPVKNTYIESFSGTATLGDEEQEYEVTIP